MGRSLRRFALGALVSGAAAAASAVEEEPGLPATVDRTITVVRDEDGAPVEGAEVEVEQVWRSSTRARATTGSDGTCLFRDSPTTGVDIIVGAPGRTSQSFRIPFLTELTAEGRKPENIDLFRILTLRLDKGRTLEGRVLSATDGKPVAGAKVEAWSVSHVVCNRPPSIRLWTAVSDTDGRFSTDRGTDEQHQVVVTAPNWTSDKFEFTDRHGQVPPATLDLVLQPAGTIRGVVTGPGEERGDGVKVVADPPPGMKAPGLRRLVGFTDFDGAFRLEGALPGVSYSLHAEGPDARSVVAGEVRVARQGQEVARDLRLVSLAGLVVRVARDTGLKLFLRVELDVQGPDVPFLRSSDREDGIHFSGILPGRYTLRVDARGWLPLVRVVELAEGETLDLDVDLEKGASLEGTVVDEAGSPVPDLRMHAGVPDPADPTTGLDEEEAFSDDGGAFRFEGVREGLLVVRLDRGVAGYALAGVVHAAAPGKGLRIVVRRK